MYRKLRRCLLYFRRDRCLFTLDRDVLFKIIYIPYVHVDIKISYVHIYIYIYICIVKIYNETFKGTWYIYFKTVASD
jgi:hypothetical protein